MPRWSRTTTTDPRHSSGGLKKRTSVRFFILRVRRSCARRRDARAFAACAPLSGGGGSGVDFRVRKVADRAACSTGVALAKGARARVVMRARRERPSSRHWRVMKQRSAFSRAFRADVKVIGFSYGRMDVHLRKAGSGSRVAQGHAAWASLRTFRSVGNCLFRLRYLLTRASDSNSFGAGVTNELKKHDCTPLH